MEKIIEAFGIDWRLISIQIFNFVLLAALLWYFLYTPVLNLLKERAEKVAQGVRDAEDAAMAKARAEEEKGVVLRDAHTEAEAVNVRAKERADEKTAASISAADTKAEGIIAGAEKKSAELKAAALKESESEIAKLAILGAERILREKNS